MKVRKINWLGRYYFDWTKKLGRLTVHFEWKSKHGALGRFGGGWDWEVGFQASRRCLIVNLLVCSLRFELAEKTKFWVDEVQKLNDAAWLKMHEDK